LYKNVESYVSEYHFIALIGSVLVFTVYSQAVQFYATLFTMSETNGNGIGDSKAKREKGFSLHHHVQTDSGAYQPSTQVLEAPFMRRSG
jgi:hypothetical protein